MKHPRVSQGKSVSQRTSVTFQPLGTKEWDIGCQRKPGQLTFLSSLKRLAPTSESLDTAGPYGSNNLPPRSPRPLSSPGSPSIYKAARLDPWVLTWAPSDPHNYSSSQQPPYRRFIKTIPKYYLNGKREN